MRYRLGSVTIEAIDTYVRITVANVGGPGSTDRVAVTKRECPAALDVARLLHELRGYWPDAAHLQACARAANDAKENRDIVALDL